MFAMVSAEDPEGNVNIPPVYLPMYTHPNVKSHETGNSDTYHTLLQ